MRQGFLIFDSRATDFIKLPPAFQTYKSWFASPSFKYNAFLDERDLRGFPLLYLIVAFIESCLGYGIYGVTMIYNALYRADFPLQRSVGSYYRNAR